MSDDIVLPSPCLVVLVGASGSAKSTWAGAHFRVEPTVSSDALRATLYAGTVRDQIGRFRALADAGVQTAIVSFPDLGTGAPIERFAEVIAAFAQRGSGALANRDGSTVM